MTHWDGLASTSSTGIPQRICVLGATNRIQDIDEAILRRMPKKFPVSLPTAQQRRGIFKLILRDTKIDVPLDSNNNNNNDNKKSRFDLDKLVRMSAGMSGSEIKEACRDAAMVPVRECIRKKKAAGSLMRGVGADEVRGLRTSDFFGGGGAGSEPSASASASGSGAAWRSTLEPENAPMSIGVKKKQKQKQKKKKKNGGAEGAQEVIGIGRVEEHEVKGKGRQRQQQQQHIDGKASSSEYETEELIDDDDDNDYKGNDNGDDGSDKDSIDAEFKAPP